MPSAAPSQTPSVRPRLEWVKPPRQARSQRTLERILDAAEALILETGSPGFTVAEVARRGRSSVGSLYARFSGKDALLRSVFERFLEQAEATVESALNTERWRGAPMSAIVEATVAFAVQVFAERRPLIAALMRRAVDDADMFGLAERLGTTTADQLIVLGEQRRAEIGHPDLRVAMRFVTWTVLCSLEANALHDPAQPLIEPAALVAELTRMCASYLDVVTPSSSTDRAASHHRDSPPAVPAKR